MSKWTVKFVAVTTLIAEYASVKFLCCLCFYIVLTFGVIHK